ncbi:DUF4249 domain-containing protein [Labilibacter sediminis]|nr:DUF4249 domain-containing protein [Labilibacter sediminis]
MRYIIFHLFIVLALVFLNACTEEIEMEFKSVQPQLVVDAVFTDQVREHYVILTRSSDFLSNEPNPAVSKATVQLRDAYNEIVLEELHDKPGVYLIPKSFRGIYGQTYTLSISGVDINEDGVEEEYSAVNTLYPVVDIRGIALGWSLTQGQKAWQVLLYTKDPEETKDYYAFTLYLNGESISPKISETEYADDKYFNGNEVNGVWVHSVVEEDNEGNPTDHVLQLGDWVKLEMQSINQDYYEFIDAVHQETGIKVPLFSGPPANVPTNVSNGARGFFRTYSLVQDSIQVTQEILDQRE